MGGHGTPAKEDFGKTTPGENGTSALAPQQSTVGVRGKGPVRRCVRRTSRVICENRLFVLFGTVVTIWALVGDDVRLCCFNKPVDKYFDGLVIFNIVFFSLEIVLCCFGKDDYFMGFFFGLDVLSTATLFLDLTVVSDALFASDDGAADADKARSGRTARVGARMGRVVRVLRLIRIVRLWKAASSSRPRKNTALGMPPDGADDPDWDDDAEAEAEPRNTKESLVGKKLSAATTQRTILLVLALLIVLPILSVTADLKTPASAAYGADEVAEAFSKMEQGTGTREIYEQVLLRYVYYHNWFVGHSVCPREMGDCSNWYYTHNFWVGITGKASEESLRRRAELAQLRRQQVEAWNSRATVQDDLYNFGTMPKEAVDILSSPWRTECTLGGLRHLGFSILSTEIKDKVTYVVQCPEDMRRMERETYTPRLVSSEQYSQWHFVFHFDLRRYTRLEAALNILTTVFVCVVLCVASLFFSNDANTLVLQPVEQMIHKVEAIRDDPLKATSMADEEFQREEMRKTQTKKRGFSLADMGKRVCCQNEQAVELMETVILEKTIIKLGSLLALGFGEAGANIVSQNMKGSNTSGVNAMIEGLRVECIVGNARIRDFSTATEVLQEKVMQFVNQIAEIVHGVVNEFHGAANQNNGDTFLIIWRTAGMSKTEVRKLTDMSVFAFAKILGGVHRSIVLANYRFHPGLQQRLGSNCRVNLSFGLHCGWAIEGAVGSEFKIDASYLSPNVSIAASVELATRIYGVSILASEAVVALCSKDMVSFMRLIDKVRFVGTPDPIQLYCVDLDYRSLPVDEPLHRAPVWNTQMRYHTRQFLEERKRELWEHEVAIGHRFEDDIPIRMMRKIYSEEFHQLFNMGYQNYAQGEWHVARQLLSKTMAMHRREDGPCQALLDFMGTPYEFQAPAGWVGVRNLGDMDDL